MPSNRSTPLGVVVIALVGGLGGLYSLLGSFATLAVNPLAAVFALVGLVFGLAQITVAAGLLTLKPWAWRIALVVFGLDALLSLVGFDLIGLVVDVVVVVYLLSVGDHFRGSPSGYRV